MKDLRDNPENNLQLLRVLFNKLPQKHIAEHLEVSQSFYCKLEGGIHPLTDELIEKLNMFYSMDVSDFLFIPKYELWLRLNKNSSGGSRVFRKFGRETASLNHSAYY
jgi:hypothetical protein